MSKPAVYRHFALYGLICLALWLPLIGTTVQAADNYLLTQQALEDGTFLPAVWYYRDETNSASLEQIKARFTEYGFSAAPRDFNAGISQPVHWFKVILPIASDFNTRLHPQLYLSIEDPIIDHIQIYHYINGQLQASHTMGASLPFHQRPFPAPNFILPISTQAADEHEFWIRVDTSSSMHLPISIETPQYNSKMQYATTLFYGALLGATIIMLLYNSLMGWRVGSKAYLYYAGVLLGGTTHRMHASGFGFEYFWPLLPEVNYYIRAWSDTWIALFSILFTQSLLNTQTISRLLDRTLSCCALIAALATAAVFILPPKEALTMALWILLIVFFLEYMVGIEAWLRGVKHSTLFLLGWFVFLGGSVTLIFAVFGAIPLNAFTAHAAEVGVIVHVLALSFALSDQINSMQREKLAAQGESARVQQELLDTQIRLNEDLDKQVQLRTAELEDANKRLNQLSSTDELTGLFNRRYFNKCLPREYQRAIRDRQPIALMIMDIDHFKQLNDNFGHQFGDLVLQEAAKIFNACIRRPPDAAIRYGGEEFVVILPHTDLAGALVVAESIRARLESTEISNGQFCARVTVSIGVTSESPLFDSDYEDLIRQADTMVYKAKAQGRNRVAAWQPEAKPLSNKGHG